MILNMQTPDKMAGPSTRFAAYLAGNTMSGRPDGYGLRVWNFQPTSDMVNVGKLACGAKAEGQPQTQH